MKLSRSLGYGGNCLLPIVENSPALVFSDVSHSYRSSPARVLDRISLSILPGERVALVGPNGAGKSTLLKLVLGMEQLGEGRITVYGHKATNCLHRVSIVPQRSTVDWRFPITVRQVVLMGRYVHLGWFKRPQKEDHEAVEIILKNMNITELADKRIGELSGGQQQRVMLARTLAHDADLILLDEPLNHLDIKTQEFIFHALEDLSKQGKTTIVSTHDLGVLTEHFSRAIFLDKRIIADGKPEEVLTPRIIASAYGFEFHKDEYSWIS